MSLVTAPSPRARLVQCVVIMVLAAAVFAAPQAVAGPKSVLGNVTLSPTSFYAGSGSTTLTYTLTARATVAVVVRDALGVAVRTLQSAKAQAPGSYSRVWDGKADGGAVLPAGSYSITVTARTSAGTVQSARSVQLVAPVLTVVGLSPTSFYAGSGSTTFTYTLTGPATVAVTVRDASGTTVRTLQMAVQTAGSYPLVWDGTADSGASLPADGYSIVVAATTTAGTEQSARTVQLLAPVLGGVGVSPPAFYIGSGSTTVSYTLAGPATVVAAVRDASGATVRTLLPATERAAGAHALVWDGTADDGASLPAGSYSAVVTASTTVGTVESTATVELVDPVLGGVGVSPASFRAGSGSTTVTYTLTVPATVVLTARDAGGATVATIQPSTALEAGIHAATWDGTAGGEALPAGGYSIVVRATTAVGSLESAESVQLLAPVLAGVGVSPNALYIGGESATISYTLTEPATASVVVTDAGGAVVRTLLADATQDAGAYALVWDGTDDGASSLPAGSYSVVVNASTAGGTEQVVKAVQLVTTALAAASASPASFYGGAGASGSTTVRYTLMGPATVAVSALDAGGAKVTTVQAPTALGAGSYSVAWGGTRTSGTSLPAGTYTLVVQATTAAGVEERSQTVQYTPTPVASEASLALTATGGHVLRVVVENWSETLNGQTAANYYFDGKAQPWEYAATSAAALTLYVGRDPADQDDTTAGGAVGGASDARGVADLAFPSSLAWYDAGGSPLPLYYSLELTYGSSSRWYPAVGRYALRPPAGVDGHVQFAYMSDIQSPLGADPTPNVAPSSLTGATGPYTAIPRLSRSLGWAAVLAALRQENAANLVLYGGDPIDRGMDLTVPDDGTAQWRSLLDNEQSFGPGDEWSLASLTSTVPMEFAPGNHDDLGNTGTASLWDRWVNHPSGATMPYFSFDQGDVHFVLLNTWTTSYPGYIGFQNATSGGSRSVTINGTTTSYSNSGQANWLIGAIATDKPWTVVVSHHPLFDSYKGQPYADSAQKTLTDANKKWFGERDRLLAFFAASGVDVVVQGHVHNYRRHVEKVRSADGAVASAMTFVTAGLAGGPPVPMADPSSGPLIDWVDLDADGAPDANEPVATADNSPYWDASAFGMRNSPEGASGYVGVPDTFHAVGEYDDGLTFAYTMFQSGSDAQGAPTLTMTVKSVTWSSATHAWRPWAVFETTQIPQADDGMVAVRPTAN